MADIISLSDRSLTVSEYDTDDAELLPAEYFGEAQLIDGTLWIGGSSADWSDAVQVHTGSVSEVVHVYVRRSSADLKVLEIVIPFHDGLDNELLEAQTEEAERYALGPKEYWRSMMVGKYTWGEDSHDMTDSDFEEYWAVEE